MLIYNNISYSLFWSLFHDCRLFWRHLCYAGHFFSFCHLAYDYLILYEWDIYMVVFICCWAVLWFSFPWVILIVLLLILYVSLFCPISTIFLGVCARFSFSNGQYFYSFVFVNKYFESINFLIFFVVFCVRACVKVCFFVGGGGEGSLV